jgi:RHS repeat-associated protein
LNGYVHTSTQKASGLPNDFYDRRGSTYAVRHGFTYDANNNVTFLDDKTNSAYDLRLTFDGLDRLNNITDSYLGTGDVNYDTMGNITYYKLGSQTINYQYNSNKQLTSTSGSKSYSFTYDDKGNVIDNGTRGFTYNSANQMVNSDGYIYTYDGNNKRVKELGSSGNPIYSFYGSNGKLMYRRVDGLDNDYYYLGDKLVAKNKDGIITFLHSDYLGSTAAESNSSGFVSGRMHYQPFGESIETPKDDVGYTGHKFDTDLGLNYMQARYYDPVIGRFYSNDPVGFKNVHNFNRYTYAANNPYKYVDPDGQDYESAYFSLKIPFAVTIDVGSVRFKPNSKGEGNKTSGFFVRIGMPASNVDSEIGSGVLMQKGMFEGAIVGATIGKENGTHTDENFDSPSASLDIGLLVGTLSIGDFAGDEHSFAIEVGPSLGVDASVSKSFTLTGRDVVDSAKKLKGTFKKFFDQAL